MGLLEVSAKRLGGFLDTKRSFYQVVTCYLGFYGLVADGYCRVGVFTMWPEVAPEVIAETVFDPLHERELITDDVVEQSLSQDPTIFTVWIGYTPHDKESESFVARYSERALFSLHRLSIQDDIVTCITKDGRRTHILLHHRAKAELRPARVSQGGSWHIPFVKPWD